MFKQVRIGTKIMLLLLTVVITAIAAISYLSYKQSQQAIIKRYGENLEVITQLKSEEISGIFAQAENNLTLLKKSFQNFKRYTKPASEDEAAEEGPIADAPFTIDKDLQAEIRSLISIYGYRDIIIANKNGSILNQGSAEYGNVFAQAEGALHDFIAEINDQGDSLQVMYSNPYLHKEDVMLLIGQPFSVNGQELLSIIEMNVSEQIVPMLQNIKGLGETGEILLAHPIGIRIEVISPLKHLESAPLTYNILLDDNTCQAVQNAAMNVKSNLLWDLDYRNESTLSYWKHLKVIGWGMVVKIDRDEINEELSGLTTTFLKSGGVILLFSIVIALMFSKVLTDPILSLKNKLLLVSKGILPKNVRSRSNDEIGEMALAVKDLVHSLQSTAGYAHQIGQGNYEADFKPMSKDDILGNALITMSESIQEAEKKDKERNWIVSGVAEIGQILRLHNNLADLGNDIIGFATDKIGAIQGAFYTLNEENEEDKFYEIKASFAYGKKKYLKGEYRFAEGLVGQCAAEQDIILRTEIPEDYVTITSGLLGDRKPSCLLFVPLITNEKVFGILEFAGFERFKEVEVQFVKEISVIVARTIFNIKVNERTVKLLKESQQMSEELQFQQEILRQNAEEMEATQEELKRTNSRLEDQIVEVNNSQKRLQVLLENASEIITIYEKDGNIRYVSPSVEPILGYTPEELIGESDLDNFDAESGQAFKDMFNQLIENPQESLTIQYEYRKKDNEAVWLEANGTNLLNDPAIQGIVINSRDITERRRAEKEERMRSQMQALSENSPDLIKRVNSEGMFFYINPVIKTITGRKPEYFLNKHIDDLHIGEEIKAAWSDIFNEVKRRKEKFTTEMELPSSVTGENHVMQVNAIPEFGENNLLESILIVSHDITERKKTEVEIRNTNKKITESINYAKRIQTAILPNDSVIKEAFPDSFIYYKPRDVVSGDFPWFIKKGNDYYIAAVDCTGHGVPGALISLIGYFILSDVVNADADMEAGRVLDLLNYGVTRTLRQDDPNATTRDGMDIALLRVNYEESFVQYAGANRPLYHLHNGELNQVKGNKFPIGGGGKYRTRTDFTTHHVDLVKGDEFYIFSDGFPDQFGGEQNKKFGQRRIREIINDFEHSNMDQIREKFAHDFETWKGDRKQTDDVLMIGLKL